MKSSLLPFPVLALAGYVLLATPAWAEVKVDSPWVRGTTNSQKAEGAMSEVTVIAEVTTLAGEKAESADHHHNH